MEVGWPGNEARLQVEVISREVRPYSEPIADDGVLYL